MVDVKYPGVSNPKAAFEALRPLDKALVDLMVQVRPYGPDYLVLNAVRKTLDTAAYHFTREPDFFSGRSGRPGQP